MIIVAFESYIINIALCTKNFSNKTKVMLLILYYICKDFSNGTMLTFVWHNVGYLMMFIWHKIWVHGLIQCTQIISITVQSFNFYLNDLCNSKIFEFFWYDTVYAKIYNGTIVLCTFLDCPVDNTAYLDYLSERFFTCTVPGTVIQSTH